MTKTERIAVLEAKVLALEKRVTETEAAAFRRLVQPVNPWWYGYPWTSPYYYTSPVGTGIGTITTGTTGTYADCTGTFAAKSSDNITYTNGTNAVTQ